MDGCDAGRCVAAVVPAHVLLRREEDNAFGQPSPTAKKLRPLEIVADAPRWRDSSGVWATHRETLASASGRFCPGSTSAASRRTAETQERPMRRTDFYIGADPCERQPKRKP